ncbi:hypothetical protein G5714_021357 [Onychostoma macrolepis]|uniref:Uncharacterized protein n=1 Tax=Onychostoma macrolepis TaxID=369639 RepID=A0A7J6BQR4_9TELE|nr:hypothetical protein G5714_021357 [Onychostoma macrolepis]
MFDRFWLCLCLWRLAAATTPDPQTPAPTIHSPHSRPADPIYVIIVLISAAAGSLVIVAVIVKFCICRKHRDAVHEDETQAAAKLYKHTGLMTESDVTEDVNNSGTTLRNGSSSRSLPPPPLSDGNIL